MECTPVFFSKFKCHFHHKLKLLKKQHKNIEILLSNITTWYIFGVIYNTEFFILTLFWFNQRS